MDDNMNARAQRIAAHVDRLQAQLASGEITAAQVPTTELTLETAALVADSIAKFVEIGEELAGRISNVEQRLGPRAGA